MSGDPGPEHDEFYRGWHIFPNSEGTTADGWVAFKLGGNGVMGWARTVAALRGMIDADPEGESAA